MPNSGTLSIWLAPGCVGNPIAALTMSGPLTYELRRTAAEWQWAVIINDVSGLSYVGSMTDCTGNQPHTAPIAGAADAMNCKVIADIQHLNRAACYEFFTPGNSIQGSGGSTTFEACP